MVQSVKVVNTMGVKDLAPRGLSAMLAGMEKGEELMIGTIFGKASGVSYRSNKFGEEPAKALIGSFEGIPVDPDESTVAASRLFLPGNIQDLLVAQVEKGNVAEKDRPRKAPPIGKGVDRTGSEVVQFAVQVGIKKIVTDDGDKYQFVVAMPRDPNVKDDLADMRKGVIADMSKAPKRISAPKKK
jgi:hypothetical protein